MLLKLLLIIGIVLFGGLLVWLAHAKLLLPIRVGACESIQIRICAFGDAPELEMQLRGLVWLRDNGLIPCSISVTDTGLTAEARAALHCFAEEKHITVSEERGTDIHGRNEGMDGDQRQHCLDHLSE